MLLYDIQERVCTVCFPNFDRIKTTEIYNTILYQIRKKIKVTALYPDPTGRELVSQECGHTQEHR